jgi:hypothetical protein
MLGSSCSPCCAPLSCWPAIVVRLSSNLSFEKQLGNPAAWEKPTTERFYLLDTVSSSAFTNASGVTLLTCNYSADFVAAHEPCLQGASLLHGVSIPLSGLRITINIRGISRGLENATFDATVGELFSQQSPPCYDDVRQVTFIANAYQTYSEVGALGQHIEYWSLPRWIAARDDPSDATVASDALLITQGTQRNPWDFTRTDGPSEYVITLGEFSISDGRVDVLEGAYSLPYPNARLFVDKQTNSEIDVPLNVNTIYSTMSRSNHLGGDLSLFWGYRTSSASALGVACSFQLFEFDQQNLSGGIVRTTTIGRLPFANNVNNATNQSSGNRPPVAGVFLGEFAILPIVESPGPNLLNSVQVGTCKASISFEP